jgi:hypothetical protein
MAVPALRLFAPRREITAADAMRLASFPAVRREISDALVQRPIQADITPNYVRYRLKDPKGFHPALFAVIRVGAKGTMIVIGTQKSKIKKPAVLASFLRRMGWTGRGWTRKLSSMERRSLMYQLRKANVVGGSETQSVLVPRRRVEAAVGRFTGGSLSRTGTNPIDEEKLKKDRDNILRVLNRPMATRVFQQLLREVDRINNAIRKIKGREVRVSGMRNPLTRSEMSEMLGRERFYLKRAKYYAQKGRLISAERFLGAEQESRNIRERYGVKVFGRNPILATLGIAANPNPRGMNIPFRAGQKVKVEAVRKWLASIPDAATRQALTGRFEANIKQYKRFHLGSTPKDFTFQQIPLGTSREITDVDFVTSEGKEWAAPYQVPRHSAKYTKDTQGRYLHAHGDSDIDIKKIKKPANPKILPERFHTADGKFVGVIPKRQRITDWYRH